MPIPLTARLVHPRLSLRSGRHAVISLVTALCACGDPLLGRVDSGSASIGSLVVRRSYALPPFSDAPMPIYLTIDHTGTTADSLLGASSPVASGVTLHGGSMEGMHALMVPAGGSLVLEPGGTHLMLGPPLPRFVRGDSVPVTLRFARAGQLTIWAVVIDYDDLDRIR